MSESLAKLDHLSIEDRLATFTEYNLATLEMLQDTKSSSKSAIRRQSSICDQMVRACAAFSAVGPQRFGGQYCSRLSERLAQPAASVSPGMETLQASECTKPVCQKCGGEVQGWTCQTCGQGFRENDAGRLVFAPMEAVAWLTTGGDVTRSHAIAVEQSVNDPENYPKALAVIPAPGNKEDGK